jgi:hypothetical protein
MKILKVSLLAGLTVISSVGYGQDNSKQEEAERVDVSYVDHRD